VNPPTTATKRILSVTALTCLCAALPGQVFRWSQSDTSSNPPAREGHAQAFDVAAGDVLLFGGLGATTFDDTWSWNGDRWTRRFPSTAPSPRAAHAMAYDAARDRVVLFGGRDDGGALLTDTWLWDGDSWTQATTANGPAGRSGHTLCYFPPTQSVICFGGTGAGGAALGDTWRWDGAGWTRLTPIASPVAREQHAVAYDPIRQRLVLFGGTSPTFGLLADTWEWDGSTWLPALSASFPEARRAHGMAFDGTRGTTVLFGGTDGMPNRETWEWNGGNWQPVAAVGVPPFKRRGAALTFDARRSQLVFFGGRNDDLLDDTWRSNADAVTIGVGCGDPPLTFTPDPLAPAWLGQVAGATITNAPTSVAVVSAGFDDQFFGPFPLPFPLVGFGMPGCNLYHTTDVFGLDTTPLSPSTLGFAFAVPNEPLLIGTHVFFQAFAFAPAANPAGLVTSNGIDWTIGCPTAPLTTIVEDFADDSQLDRDASAADWSGGVVTFARIGGDGRHGDFDLGLCTDTGEVDADGRTIYLLDCDDTTVPAADTTSGADEVVTDGRFFFASMVVPSSARVRLVGTTPPRITVAGRVAVQGVLENNGASLTSVPSSSTVPGQAGASGGCFGGAGGDGGARSPGEPALMGDLGQYQGQDGEPVQVIAGHGYAGAIVPTPGRGSTMFPGSGLDADMLFATNPPIGLQYSFGATAGGSGGGLFGLGGTGRVTGVLQSGSPIANESSYFGPLNTGGAAMQLFPYPGAGLQSSSEHFAVGGAGGGGSASACTMSLSISTARSWAPGAGGGGGAGPIVLRVGRQIDVDAQGAIESVGGSAADNGPGTAAGPQVSPGGGGAGGSVVLLCDGTTNLAGDIDVRGGRGGRFSRTAGGGFPPNGGIVTIEGGDGGQGFVRLETSAGPQLSDLSTVTPPATTDSLGMLAEQDTLVSTRSRFYATNTPCGVYFLSYELHATVDGVPVVYSDDPEISPLQATAGAALRVRFQAGDVDPLTGDTLSTGPWRATVASTPTQAGIGADGLNGYRFVLVVDRALANTVVVDSMTVRYVGL